MESVSVKHDDGAIDTVQRGAFGSPLGSEELERLYWSEIGRATFGVVRFARGAIRLAGVWPPLLRFGPLHEGSRSIDGGLFARKAGGTIAWHTDDAETSVSVIGFTPLLTGPLWRVEAWLHDRVGRRFLRRVAREVG